MNDRPIIALARRDIERLRAEKAARAAGVTQPINIRLLLDDISLGGAVPMTALSGQKNEVALVYHFDLMVILWAILGRSYVFMVWGLPSRGRARDAIARFVLRRAKLVVANDPVSKREALLLTGGEVRIVPYMIDTDFWTPDPVVSRRDFLFCPSSNGRDPEVLLGLAQNGYQVTWMCNDRELIKRYKDASPNLKIAVKPDFEALRHLYRTCRACILPIQDESHAVGQTTTLEALACGASVFITTGRTSEIFAGQPLIDTVKSSKIEHWASALGSTINLREGDWNRNHILEKHNLELSKKIYREIFSS